MIDGIEPRADVTPPVDDVLAGVLEKPPAQREEALTAACRRWPSLERSLRARYARLEVLGFLDPPAVVAAAPDRIGDYRLLRCLGEGGMGVVYLAEQEPTGRRVALKVIKPEYLLVPRARERFQREALAASRIEHPGICAVYEVGDAGGTPFIAMPYLEGETLARRIERARSEADPGHGPSSGAPATRNAIHTVVGHVEKAARALHFAHERGLVHRDVKPGNLLITTDGRPVVLDFGLARDDDAGNPSLTRTGDPLGTPAYMAPEQVSGERSRVDRRADVYALGVTLYESLTLEPPFRAPTRAALYREILTRDPVDPRRHNPHLSRDLAVVIATALEKEPDRRYATAADLADDLAAVQKGKPIAARPVSRARRVLRWARREPLKAALAAVITIALALVTGLGGYLVANLDSIQRGRTEAERERLERQLQTGFAHLLDFRRVSIGAFEQALRLVPDNPEAVAGLAMARAMSGQAAQALSFLDSHAPLVRHLPSLQRIRIELLRRLEREDEARAVEASLPAPATALDFYLLGSVALNRAFESSTRDTRAQFREAMRLFEQAIRRGHQARALVHYSWATAAGFAGDREAAREAAAILPRHWPGLAATFFHVGQALHRIDSTAAVEAFRKAIALEPDVAAFHFYLGVAACAKRDWNLARSAFETSDRLQPDNPSTLHNLGRVARLTGRIDDALAYMQRAIAIRPGYAAGHYALGVLYLTTGRPREAIPALERAIELEPDAADARVNLGHAHYQAGDLVAARGIHERTIERHPDHAASHMNLAVVLTALDDLAAAEGACRKACSLQPGNPVSLYNLGRILRHRGRFGEALERYRAAQGAARNTPDLWLAEGDVVGSARGEAGDCEVLAACERALAIALEAGNRERVVAALRRMDRKCTERRFWIDAALFYRRALQQQPAFFTNPTDQHRLRAAICATIGAYHLQSSVPARARRWRRQALAWLEENLNQWTAALDADEAEATEVRRRISRWRSLPALAGIAHPDLLAKLPPEDRDECRAFWESVDAVLNRLEH